MSSFNIYGLMSLGTLYSTIALIGTLYYADYCVIKIWRCTLTGAVLEARRIAYISRRDDRSRQSPAPLGTTVSTLSMKLSAVFVVFASFLECSKGLASALVYVQRLVSVMPVIENTRPLTRYG